MSTVVRKTENGIIRRSKKKEDFLEPVFDPQSTAYNTFFAEYGINRFSLSSLLWMVRGIQYYQLRHVAVCGPDGRTQQEIPASILFSKNGFFDGILSTIPPGSVILEALPTADSGTNDPTGYIHSQVRGKGKFKLGYLATGVADTGKISIREGTIPSETRYGEPMNVVYYQKFSSQTMTPLKKTEFCVESARRAYAKSLEDLGNSHSVMAKLGAFFDPRTEEDLKGGFLEDRDLLTIMENLRIMSGYKRKITQEFLLEGTYPLKIYENYLNNAAFYMLTEVMDREKVLNTLFSSYDQPPLQILDAKFKSTTKRILKSIIVQYEKIQQIIPGGHVTLCKLDLDPVLYSTRGRQSKSFFLTTTKNSFNQSLLKIQYDEDQTHNNAVEVTRENEDKVYLTVIEGIFMLFYCLIESEERENVKVINSIQGFPLDIFNGDSVSSLVRDLYELGMAKTIEKYPDTNQEIPPESNSTVKLEMLLKFSDAIPVDLSYKSKYNEELDFDQIEFKKDQVVFDEIDDCLEINCSTCYDNKELANCVMFKFDLTTALFVICKDKYYLCMIALCRAIKLNLDDMENEYDLEIGTGLLILNNHQDFENTDFKNIDIVLHHLQYMKNIREELLQTYLHLQYFDLYSYLTFWDFQTIDFHFTKKVVEYNQDLVYDNGKRKVTALVKDFKKDYAKVKKVSMKFTYDYKDKLKAIEHHFVFTFENDLLIVIAHFNIKSEKYVYKIHQSKFFQRLTLTKFNLNDFCETLHRNFEDIFFDMNSKLEHSLKCQILLDYVINNKPFNHYTDFLCNEDALQSMPAQTKIALSQAFLSLTKMKSKSQYPQSFRYLNLLNKLNEITFILDVDLKIFNIDKILRYTKPLETFLKIMTTVSHDTLPVVHVKNDFENTSFWNYCNGEVLDFSYKREFFEEFTFPDNTATGTLFSLLVSIYTSLLTYAHSEKNFVSSAMDENMKNYVTYLFSICYTFRMFVDYVLKSMKWVMSDEELLIQDFTIDQIEAISLFLNLDIQIYELQDLKKTLCKNSFVISRTKRFNISLNKDHMFLDPDISNHELFAFSSNGVDKESTKRSEKQIWVECITTESAETFLNEKKLRTTSFTRENLNDILEKVVQRLPGKNHLKTVYTEALNILREHSMLSHEKDNSWAEQEIDGDYKNSFEDEMVFWETNNMTLWKCQTMMQMVISSHYNNLQTFYYSKNYEDYTPKNEQGRPFKFSELFLEEFFDCFMKFIDQYFFDLKDFILHPIDLEIISEYLDIGITFFHSHSYNNVLRARRVMLKKTKLEGMTMISADLPIGIPYTDYTVNWQFGECYETDSINSYLEKNLVLYSDFSTNDQCYQLSTEKNITLLVNKNPDNLTKFSNSQQSWSHYLRFRSMFSETKETKEVERVPAEKPSYQVFVSNQEMIENIFKTLKTFLDWESLKKEISNEENAGLCKLLFNAHQKQYIINNDQRRHMVTREMRSVLLKKVQDVDSLKVYLKEFFNYLPIALFELIAKASNKRFIMVNFRTRNFNCRSVSDMFRIDDSCFQFYDYLDYDNSYDMNRDTHVFIVQPFKKETSTPVEDGGSNTYMVCAVGALPYDIIESMTEKKQEEQQNDSDQEKQSDVESKFQLGTHNYLGVVNNDYPKAKSKWVTPIPINLLQPLPKIPHGLEQFPKYQKMFVTHNYQPIIMTHRSFPKPVSSYSIRNFPYKITADINVNLYDELDSFAKIGKPVDKMKVDTTTFEELYDYETLAKTYLQEATDNIKHTIDLEIKIEKQDITTQAIETFSDILRCIRITLAVTNKLNWKDQPVNSKFFNEISQEARGSDSLQYLFRIYGVFASQVQADFFSYRSRGREQYYRANCHGIWHPKNITMTIAMRILNYYIHYLELTSYTYILRNNDNDNNLLEFLRKTRERWFQYKSQTKTIESEKYLVEIDEKSYDRYYKDLQGEDTSKYKDLYEADIRTLSILYHLDFKKLSGFGNYESNTFTESPFTYLLQSSKKQGRSVTKTIKYYTFENIEKKRKENQPVETITNRFCRNINFPPWIRNETELEKIGEKIYKTERNFYKKFTNYPRLTIYLLSSKGDKFFRPVIGHLFIKGKTIKLEELEHPEKIEDRWEPTQQEIEENKAMKERKEKKKEIKNNPKAKEKSKSDDGEKAKVVFSGACNNYDEWEERGDYRDSDEDYRHRTDEDRERGQMSLYRANGKRDTNVNQDSNGNLFRMDRNGRHYYDKTYNKFDGEFSLGNNMIIPFDLLPAKNLSADAQHTVIYAEESNKEIHMLTLCLAHLIVGLDNLADGGYMTSKFNKGLLTQSRMLATMLLPCFDEVTAYPVPIFTDHILFAGKGFSRARMLQHKVLDRLKGCMDLSENSVRREYETLMGCFDDKASWGKFETRVDSCSEQLMYQSCLDDLKMAQVLIESTFSRDGNVRPGSGAQAWLDAATANAFNKRVFSRISRDERAANQSLLQALVQTDYGMQLRNVFAPVIAKLDGPRASPGRVELVDPDE